MRFLVATIFILSACASTQRIPSSKDFPWGLASNDLPDSNAVIRWSNPHYEESNVPILDDLDPVQVPAICPDPKLYPTHPQQRSKSYHVYRVAVYENEKLAADSPVCKLTSNGAKKFCLLADTFQYAVISDVFQDACGGLYRGVWSVGFLKRDDNVGMLLSKGRTVYTKPNASFEGDVEDGQTYALEAKDFLLLTAPFPGDKETAAKLAGEAKATHTYDSATHLFQKKGVMKAESRHALRRIALRPTPAE
jgi:hypothetical protein